MPLLNPKYTSPPNPSSQSEIDYDIWLKGKNILNDPSLSITEPQRYKDALKQKDEDFS